MIYRVFLCCLFVCVFAISSVPAFANILITPTHIVFDDRQRFADVTLANTSNKVQAYELSWVLYKMTEGSGTYTTDGVNPKVDLSDFIRFAPRRVTLPPASKQKIRLSFKRPADILEGDYHIHLKFQVSPTEEEPIVDRPIEKAVVHVSINVNYTIPVVVRIGEPQIETKIGQISLDRNSDTGALQMILPVERIGSPHSLIGYIRVFHKDERGNEVLVGEISNANIFPEISKRTFTVPLRSEVSGGSFRVEIRNNDKQDDFVHAQKIFDLE